MTYFSLEGVKGLNVYNVLSFNTFLVGTRLFCAREIDEN